MGYTLRYFYCNKQYRQKNKHKFWIYPKMYCAILTENEIERLKGKQAFLCLTKREGQDKLVKKVGFIVNIAPATLQDEKKYKDLKLVDSYTPNKEQLEALHNFQKIKFGIE